MPPTAGPAADAAPADAAPVVIVTRPSAQAAGWVAQLQAHGLRTAALPLIDIAAPPDAGALAAAWAQLERRRLVVFVSPTAVERFFAARPGAAWPGGAGGPMAAAAGPGTSQALRRAGVPAPAIVEPVAGAVQFDSEALWAALCAEAWSRASVLIVRGDGGRDWLATRLRAAGAQVDAVQAYRRVAPEVAPGSGADRLLAAAAAAPGAHCWLFSSSQAIDHLQALRPALPWAAMQAVATHPRIAERAVAAGIGRVVASRPTLPAVAQAVLHAAGSAAIDSLQSTPQ